MSITWKLRIALWLWLALLAVTLLTACQGHINFDTGGAAFYPERGWADGGDPAESRAASHHPSPFSGISGMQNDAGGAQ